MSQCQIKVWLWCSVLVITWAVPCKVHEDISSAFSGQRIHFSFGVPLSIFCDLNKCSFIHMINKVPITIGRHAQSALAAGHDFIEPLVSLKCPIMISHFLLFYSYRRKKKKFEKYLNNLHVCSMVGSKVSREQVKESCSQVNVWYRDPYIYCPLTALLIDQANRLKAPLLHFIVTKAEWVQLSTKCYSDLNIQKTFL